MYKRDERSMEPSTHRPRVEGFWFLKVWSASVTRNDALAVERWNGRNATARLGGRRGLMARKPCGPDGALLAPKGANKKTYFSQPNAPRMIAKITFCSITPWAPLAPGPVANRATSSPP